MNRVRHVWLAAMLVLALGADAGEYPVRPIQIVVPFPPGAAADTAVRTIAPRMAASLGQPIVVRNHPGVPGILAVSRAAPDGYTLLVGAGSNMVTQPLLARQLPYSPRNFAPVGRAIVNVPILTAHPALGVRSAQELIGLARAQPGRLNYSSSGTGSPGHLAMEMFQALTGTSMVHVPYKGGASAVTALMGHHVHVSVNALPSVIGPVRQGRLVPLAVGSTARSPALPDVPTMAESGVPEFDYEIWYGLFAPARAPVEVVHAVSQALQAALQDTEVVRQLESQGADPSPSSPQELADYIARDTARWERLISERRLDAAAR